MLVGASPIRCFRTWPPITMDADRMDVITTLVIEIPAPASDPTVGGWYGAAEAETEAVSDRRERSRGRVLGVWLAPRRVGVRLGIRLLSWYVPL